ncbi:anti-sigma factor [Sulfitobacter sp. BSw21498]|uniref:anti-sigma factor n=1 Tax=Sulfitobacter sp. BSw21498 TaxID=664426 RepID=UPI0011105FFD|nr:anti-sigma factor [Sulfitobacter sp. BSw21498]
MTQTPEIPDDDLLAAEMVLGLSSDDDMIAASRRIGTERDFADRVVFWQERMTAMTDGIDPVAPPARIKKKLMAQVFPKQRVTILQRLWLWQGVAMASLLFAGYLGVQLLEANTRPDGQPIVLAAQLVSESSPLEMLAVIEPVKHEIALRRVAGEPIPGREFEVWAILPDQAPVSLGVLPDSETTRILVPAELRSRAAQITLAISDEPIGGSPTGAPTGAVLAAGAMSEL